MRLAVREIRFNALHNGSETLAFEGGTGPPSPIAWYAGQGVASPQAVGLTQQLHGVLAVPALKQSPGVRTQLPESIQINRFLVCFEHV